MYLLPEDLTEKWKSNVYDGNAEHTLRIFIDNIEVNIDHVLGYKSTYELFGEDGFRLGCTPQRDIELLLYKDAIDFASKVMVEYGIKIDEDFFYIPIGNFTVTKLTNVDDYTLKITASDNMFKFNKKYNGSTIVPATLDMVLIDICNQIGVELATADFLNDNVETNMYDSTETAREFLSYIAEQAGCFACIGRDGKLYLKSFFESENVIDDDYVAELNWYTDYTLSGITYQDAIRNYTAGDNSLNVLRINPDNMYIKEQLQINNVFNKLEGFSSNGFEGTCLIDPRVDIGDKIVIQGKSIIYQAKEEFVGRLKATISSRIQTKEVEDTVEIKGEKQEKRMLKTTIDQANMKIELVAEEQTEHTTRITKTEQDVESINNSVKRIGGNNKQLNSVGAFGTSDYEQNEEGTIVALETEELRQQTESGRAIVISTNKWFKMRSESLVVGQEYTISFKYSNIEFNTALIKLITNIDTVLVETEEVKTLNKVEYTFIADKEYVELYVETGEYELLVSDYYLQTGSLATSWQPGTAEVMGQALELYYNGIKVTADNSEIITQINNLGFSVLNKNGKILITANKDNALLGDTIINGYLKQGSWKEYVQNISGFEYKLEVFE